MNKPSEPGLGRSTFHMVPCICSRHGFHLVRLERDSAVFNVGSVQFTVKRPLIVASTAFRFEQRMPARVKELVEDRNQHLRTIGWVLQPGLVLICPAASPKITEKSVGNNHSPHAE